MVAVEMSLNKKKGCPCFLRTLELLNQQFTNSRKKATVTLRKLKTFFNVIQSPMLEIQLDQLKTAHYIPLTT